MVTICLWKQSVPTEPDALLASRGNPATEGGGGVLSRYNVFFPVNVFFLLRQQHAVNCKVEIQ